MSDSGMREILITGGAGFIGSNLLDRLLWRGDSVTVMDNLCEFYDPQMKADNIASHLHHKKFRMERGDIRNIYDLESVFSKRKFDVVVHLAALAGVRPSLKEPAMYMDVNVLGTQRLLDQIEKSKQKPLFIFGGSSSVYGERPDEKFAETDNTSRPLSPYAASKVAGEALCFTAHHTTGLKL